MKSAKEWVDVRQKAMGRALAVGFSSDEYEKALEQVFRECQADALEAAALECEKVASQMHPYDARDLFPRKNFAAETIRNLKPKEGE